MDTGEPKSAASDGDRRPPEAVIFIGIQATGKSTSFRDRFWQTHVRINLDMLRTRHREDVQLKTCMEQAIPFVVDNTNPTVAERAKYMTAARVRGFRVAGYYFESKVAPALVRNAARPSGEIIPERGIRGTAGRLDPAVIAATFTRWYTEGRLTGLGAATLGAVAALAKGGHWALVGRRGEMAAGNGAAMRGAPVGLWLDPATETGRRTIRDISRITHHHDEAYAGALAVAAAVRETLMTGAVAPGLLRRVASVLPDSAVRDRCRELGAVDPLTSIGARD